MAAPRLFLIWLVVSITVSLASVPAFAQNQNGTIRGVVLDPQGAVVANANVTATNQDTLVVTTTKTSAVGAYAAPDLPVGPYELKIEAPGFAAYVRPGVQVLAAQITDVTATLTLGSPATTIRVESGADVIQTESFQFSGTFESRTISDVPVATGNNLSVLNLAVFLPNTTAAQGGTSGTGGSFGGLRSRQNNFSVDGVDNNDPTATQLLQPIIPDAVQEFAVNQNVFNAEYGRGSGGQFNVMTKTGTDQLHFDGWFYNGNRAYDATNNQEQANILSHLQSGKSRYDFNRLGGDAGGPLLKNRLFLYGAYEYDDLNQPAIASSGTAPTAAGLATLTALAVDSQARAIITQFPTAPSPSSSVTVDGQPIPIGIVNSTAPSYTRLQNYIINGDMPLTPQQNLHIGYLQTWTHAPEFGTFPQPQFASSSNLDDVRVILNHAWTASPNLVNDFAFTYSRFSQNFPLSGVAQNYPTIDFGDLPGLVLGPNASLPQNRGINEYLLGDSVSWTHGPHTVKWGGQYYWYISPWNFLSDQRGFFGYSTLNQLVNDQVPGIPNGSAQGIGNGFFSGNSKNFDLFAQDDLKLTPHLTVSFGLRYDFFGNPSDVKLNALNSIASLPGTPLVFNVPKSDRNNFGPHAGFAWDPTGSGKWAVRGGASVVYDVIPWSFYINGVPAEREEIVSPALACFGVFGTAPSWCTTGAGFLAGGAMNLNFVAPTNQAFARALTAQMMTDAKDPKVFSWSLDIQREIARNTRLDLRYLGTRALELPIQFEANSISAFENGAQPLPTYIQASSIPATVSASAPTLAQFQALEGLRYAAQGFNGGFAVQAAPLGSSTYEGASIEVLHRFSGNLFVRANYTYSKTMDDATNDLFTSVVDPRRPQNPYDLQNEWARSVLDVPNKVAFTFVYDLPKVNLTNRFVRGIANGWEWTGSYVFQSGQPITIQSGVDSNGNLDTAGDRAVLNPGGTEGVGSLVNPVCRNPLTGATSVATTCAAGNTVGYAAINPNAKYIQAGVGAISTLGRNTYTSPYMNVWNMALLKNTAVKERMGLQLRIEAYDVFNHPDYTLGNMSIFPFATNAMNPGYASLTGVPSGTFLNSHIFNGGSRVVQLGLKVTY